MLLDTPKDKAISRIRLAMSLLFHANKGLLAQRLVKKLERPVCDVSARKFYPSWCKRFDPYQAMTPGISVKFFLRAAVRHLWNACLDFEAAGIFSAEVVTEELLEFPGSTTGPIENLSARSSQRQ
jgi:hypothetical protein